MPLLDELPPPPAGREGWPWTKGATGADAGAGAPARWAAGGAPRISVVIPSFQQAAFLEETLRSVILQDWPDLEVIVMDGGSTDGSVEIIRRYEPWIAAWVSEKDGGQTAAINAGWRRATGALLTYLNSDDTLLPGWAAAMAGALIAEPDIDVAMCQVQVTDGGGAPQWVFPALPPTTETLLVRWMSPGPQPGFLMRGDCLSRFGELDARLRFAMDTEYWMRVFAAGARIAPILQTLATFRIHGESKTTNLARVAIGELLAISEEKARSLSERQRSTADRIRHFRHWNAAKSYYAVGMYDEARTHALKALASGGVRRVPHAMLLATITAMGRHGQPVLSQVSRWRARLGQVRTDVARRASQAWR